MRSKLLIAIVTAVGLFVIARPLSAHHAGANYDREHLITLSGTVTEYDYTNPHVQIHFDVKDAHGNIVKWIGVGDPPQRLYKAGWTKTSVKVGDQITVTGGPRKDGSKEIDMRDDQLTINGKKLSFKAAGGE